MECSGYVDPRIQDIQVFFFFSFFWSIFRGIGAGNVGSPIMNALKGDIIIVKIFIKYK